MGHIFINDDLHRHASRPQGPQARHSSPNATDFQRLVGRPLCGHLSAFRPQVRARCPAASYVTACCPRPLRLDQSNLTGTMTPLSSRSRHRTGPLDADSLLFVATPQGASFQCPPAPSLLLVCLPWQPFMTQALQSGWLWWPYALTRMVDLPGLVFTIAALLLLTRHKLTLDGPPCWRSRAPSLPCWRATGSSRASSSC
jgi:hypothetical protein